MAPEENVKPEQMKELLDAFSEKIPVLLDRLAELLYGKENAQKYAQAVAGFYTTVRESGMKEEQAFKLTEEYMSSLSMGKILGSAMGERRSGARERGHRHEGKSEGDDG